MKRYLYLLKDKIETEHLSYRTIGMNTGLPAMSISDYVLLGTEPRLKALEKLATYFQEPIEAMLLEQTEDTHLDVKIYQRLHKMTPTQKSRLLSHLEKP